MPRNDEEEDNVFFAECTIHPFICTLSFHYLCATLSLSFQILSSSVVQALQELRVNRLRTVLSLLGITIGIFCIIAVLTVINSMENNIRSSMSSLGGDVLYINRKPWMGENGEFKWWEYLQRPPMGTGELEQDCSVLHPALACPLSAIISPILPLKLPRKKLRGWRDTPFSIILISFKI